MGKLKVFTAFSGYDSQMLALRRAGVDCDLVGWSEIDKYAVQAHDILFPEYKNRNHGDIKGIDWGEVADFDLFTYSSPCQDFSIAGNHQGGEKGSGTRSSLLWECERAIKVKKPKYLLFENVPGILTPKNKPNFDKWRKKLESLGYANHYEVLNAADFGVPQGRKRVYMFSVLGGKESSIKYPEPRKLNKTIADVIEDNVSKDYFLTDKGLVSRINEGLRKYEKGMNFKFEPTDTNGIARTLRTSSSKLTDNYIISYSRDDYGNIKNYHPKDISNTLTCQQFNRRQSQYLKWRGKIRRLTPLEYFRLMGLKDSEAKKLMSAGISDTQLYKLAGNSIVVDVLEAIFREVFKGGKSKGETLGEIGGYNDFWYRTVNVYARYFKGLKLLVNKLEYDKKVGRFELYVIKGNILYDHTTSPNTPEAKRDIRQYIDRIDKTMDVEWISDKKFKAPSKTPGKYMSTIFSLFEKAAQMGARNRDIHRALYFKERYKKVGLKWPGLESVIGYRGNSATLRNKERELGLEHQSWYSWDIEQEKATKKQVRL